MKPIFKRGLNFVEAALGSGFKIKNTRKTFRGIERFHFTWLRNKIMNMTMSRHFHIQIALLLTI